MSSDRSNYDRAADMNRAPLYRPQQMAALLLDLYKFLSTLHYDPSDLKVAPAHGWPDLTPEHCAHFRGGYALQVLRYLPYLGGQPPQQLHYQCEVVDYTVVHRGWFVKHHMDSDTNDEWWSTLSQVPTAWMLPLALGVGVQASSFYLNVVDAEVCEVISGLGDAPPKPLATWVAEMKELFASLQLIPCDGKRSLVCKDVKDIERINEDEFRAEEGYFPTDLDVRFIRQVYRDYGWPKRFRYKEAMAYLLPLLEDIVEDNDDRWWIDWA